MSDETYLDSSEPIETEEFVPEDTVRLPVGIEVDGTRYRNVVIDELSGVDDHNLASKKTGNNGAKGTTIVLCRCVQEVDGLLKAKQNPEKLFDRSFARKMTVIDRDFLLAKIYQLGGENEVVMAGECPRCQKAWEEDALLSDLEVIEWPEDEPLELEFELPAGYTHIEKNGERTLHKKGVIRFATGSDQEQVAELSNPAQAFDAMFAACIKKLGDLESIDQEVVKRFKSRDRRYLMQFLQLNLPGLRQWKIVKCSCGREFDITTDLTAFFDGRRSSAKKR